MIHENILASLLQIYKAHLWNSYAHAKLIKTIFEVSCGVKYFAVTDPELFRQLFFGVNRQKHDTNALIADHTCTHSKLSMLIDLASDW